MVNDQAETVLAYWRDHREHLRHSETQRAVLTNFVLVIASVLTGLAVQQKFARNTWPVAVLLMVVGVFGAVAVAKYHERANYHLERARACTENLINLGVLPGDDAPRKKREKAHNNRYPRLQRMRLHVLWTGLHCAIAVLGLALAVTILVE